MNDFTKDELNIIFYWAIDRVESVGIDFFREEGHDVLYKKIQSMIDDYCDHNPEPSPEICCVKCQKTLL